MRCVRLPSHERRISSIVTRSATASLGVACAALVCVFFAGASHADETCNSPYMSKLIKGQEDYVYVWTLGVEGSATARTSW